VPGKLLQLSERTARHSAAWNWHSDGLFARSDSFVACREGPQVLTLGAWQAPAVVGANSPS
jgi:hypothetical protein